MARDEREVASGPLAILLTCPQCGAPTLIEEDAVSFSCAHCASFLIVAHPGRDELYLGESQVPGPEDVRLIVVQYRVQAHRAELIARFGSIDEQGQRVPPPELFLEAKLRQYETALLAELRLPDLHRLHVPYWHIGGMIVQAILGREHDGPKQVRVRAFSVEHSVPGYDTRAFNMRDRGLRLSRSRVRPLSRREAAEQAPFLPWMPVPEQTYAEIRKWQGRDLDPDLEPVTKRGGFLFGRRVLVYRPYWLARVVSASEQTWVLVDCGFAAIAGYPSETEVRSLLDAAIDDPEGPESRETRAVVAPSRCPDCGFEAAFDRRSRIVICANCHLALAPEEGGVRVVSCGHALRTATDLDASYLPFWVFPFRIAFTGGAALDRLEAYAKALFPQGLPPGFRPSGAHLFVPAFRLLGTERGDQVFKELAEWIHGAPPEIEEGKVPLGGRATFHGVTLSEDEARETLAYLLYAVHGRPSAARLNTLLLKRMVEQAKIEAPAARLVLVPFDRTGAALVTPGAAVTIPMLLLEGGHALDQQRVTVYQANRATERSSS